MLLTRPLFVSALLPLIAALTLACARDEAPTPPNFDRGAIRRIDFTDQPAVITALRQIGSGSIERGEVVYGDLTGDGGDEAVVPVTSGGSVGNIAYLVFTMRHGAPSLILTRRLERGSAAGLRMTLRPANGRFVLRETAAEYGPEDPFCCPSVLRETTFRWDGSNLQVDREERTEAAPNPKTRGD